MRGELREEMSEGRSYSIFCLMSRLKTVTSSLLLFPYIFYFIFCLTSRLKTVRTLLIIISAYFQLYILPRQVHGARR